MEQEQHESLRTYGEWILRWMEKFDLSEPFVLGTYEIQGRKWPLLRFNIKSSSLLVRYEPGRWPASFIVSVDSTEAIPSLFGLFDPTLDLRVGGAPADMDSSCIFGPYKENHCRFSCELEDEWDLAMLIRILRSLGLLTWAAVPEQTTENSAS